MFVPILGFFCFRFRCFTTARCLRIYFVHTRTFVRRMPVAWRLMVDDDSFCACTTAKARLFLLNFRAKPSGDIDEKQQAAFMALDGDFGVLKYVTILVCPTTTTTILYVEFLLNFCCLH